MVAPSAEMFLQLFPPGRSDCFGYHDGRRASVVKKTLDEFVIRQHLSGKIRIGIFPLDHEGLVRWAVLDLDESGVTPVLDLVQKARDWGMSLAVERSKEKGFHIWIFFSKAVPGEKIRVVLHGLLTATGWHERRFEVFPKQSTPGKDGFGNYIFAPLHGGSARDMRTLFVDLSKDQWPPQPDQIHYLQSLPRYSETDLDQIIARHGLKAEGVHPSRDNGDTRQETTLPLPPCAAKIYTEGIGTPGRSDWSHFLARHLRRRGIPEEAAQRLLLDWNQKNRPEPLEDTKVREMVANTYRKGYTSLGCEYLTGAKEICGDACVLKPKENSSESICLSDVAPERIEWLWPGRLPRGKFAVLIGDPGLGKSTMCVDIMARVTVGATWPDGGRAPKGNCVLLTAEDGLADTVRPRLDAAGGDPARVFILQAVKDKETRRMFNLTQDLAHLERLVCEKDAIQVVIDPVSAYLGKVDTFRDSDIRNVLAPLASMAERTGATVLGVMHLTKNEQRQVIHRAQGSIAFVASARAVFGVVEDKDHPDRIFLLPIKTNVTRKPPGLSYRLGEKEGVVNVVWDTAPVHVDLHTAFSPPVVEDKGDLDRAKDFLEELLTSGVVPSKVVFAEAEKAKIAYRTLVRAKENLKIKPEKDHTPGGQWSWGLPKNVIP